MTETQAWMERAGSSPLLATKLYVPPARPNRVPRPRLVARLNEALDMGARLILLSAPAGFGKTTLLSAWLGDEGERAVRLWAGWISLDEGDNDPARFTAYLIAALQTFDPRIGEGMVGVLQGPQPPPLESLLTVLVNDLASLPAGDAATSLAYILVLDDYHLIKAGPVHQVVSFLLEHAPSHLHLVIASRSDPPLHLPRLRGRGQLLELRVEDLRFSGDEASAFLNQVMGLDLAAEEVDGLGARTEGWITGLQLAALSLQGQDAGQKTGFVEAFTGSNRYVLDYLVEEVLQREPEPVQSFLLRTSILDRMTGPLCDAVLESEGSQALLERLEQDNLFIVPLDGERRWYRYHRLFADLLRGRLGRERAAPLHHRASQWYERNGYVAEAIHHALTAGDLERVADLVEATGLQMLMRGELTTLLGWLARLPGGMVRARPWLCIYQAWALLLTGQLEGIEPPLRLALEPTTPGVPPPTPEMRGHAAAIRSYAAAIKGEVSPAIELAQQALAWLPDEELTVRSVVAFTLGGTRILVDDIAGASQAFAEASRMGLDAGNIHLAVPAMGGLAAVLELQGKLRESARIYQRSLQLAEEQGAGRSLVGGQAHSGLGELAYEWNDLARAEHHLTQAVRQNRLWGNVESLANCQVSLARLHLVQGDAEGAWEMLRQAEQVIQAHTVTALTGARVAACWPWLWLAQGNLAAAERWVHERGLSPGDEPDLSREHEYLSLARILLAGGRPAEATGLLARMRQLADNSGRQGSVIKTLALLALAHQSQNDAQQAMVTLEQALSLAEPEGYVRTFVDEGQPLAALLPGVSSESSRVSQAYVERLQAAFGLEPADKAPRTKEATSLVEPLSDREREVLRLVAQGLTNQEIADRLVIAVSTVKSHTNHIYGKLGVKNRTQAINRAQTLDLL